MQLASSRFWSCAVLMFTLFGASACKSADPRVTLTSACTIRKVADMARMSASDTNSCPTMAKLTADHQLEANKPDSWGTPFDLKCEDEGVKVTSAGPDKQLGTNDDIVANQESCAPFKAR